MADEAMAERSPTDRPRAPNASGRRGGDGTAQRMEEGDDTSRRASAAGRTADEAMTERAPPERPQALNASGQEGGEGRGDTPTQRRANTARSKGEGGGTQKDRRGNPP